MISNELDGEPRGTLLDVEVLVQQQALQTKTSCCELQQALLDMKASNPEANHVDLAEVVSEMDSLVTLLRVGLDCMSQYVHGDISY